MTAPTIPLDGVKPVPPTKVTHIAVGPFPKDSTYTDSVNNVFAVRDIDIVGSDNKKIHVVKDQHIGKDLGAGGVFGTGIGPAEGLPTASDAFNGLIPRITGDLRHFAVRAAEVLIGLLLIAVGIAKLTNAVPAATKIAKALK